MSAERTDALRITPLGGLGEIGMNLMVYEFDGQMILVDCGLTFPTPDTPGVDFIIPDMTFLEANVDKILGVVLTHGHEDHLGALPHVWESLNRPPIHGCSMSLGILTGKFREHGLLDESKLRLVRQGERIQIGPFSILFIPVTHSIIDASALAISTPVGVVVHTGDFKLDHTPGPNALSTDLLQFAQQGKQGVLALLSDSTNVTRPGGAPSEQIARGTLSTLISEARGLLIIASFASNIQRIQQVLELAQENDRRVILAGRSLLQNVQIARELGFLTYPSELLADLKSFQGFPRDKVLVLSTGSQGEPNSALSRIAAGEHREIQVGPEDTVILSSRFIPGNERPIWRMINLLSDAGARVIHEKDLPNVHVSGHAPRGDLELMIALTRPRFFVPIHGEPRHLHLHRELAMRMGIPPENALIAHNGDRMELTADSLSILDQVPHGRVFVDGKGVGDVGDIVLRDRQHLSQDGLVVVVMVVETNTDQLLEGPELLTRGVVYEDESQDLLEEARQAVQDALALGPKGMDFHEDEEVGVKDLAVRALRRFFKKRLGRRPVVLPLVMEM